MQTNSFDVERKKRVSLTVSELNRQVKQLLEASFLQIWVEGELTSFSKPSSGHWYFTLKDEKAQIRCAMFRGQNQRLRFTPKEGDKVTVRTKVSLYEGRGDYQLIVESMEPSGAGDLQKAFEALKAKLSAEGLFNQDTKKALPTHPRSIAVITSPTGAAIHDILSVLKRRFPETKVTIYPTAVQGDSAAPEIARMIKLANIRKESDVIIVGRGGGSLEDLWAFNEEAVARAIHESVLPIVSAVGHEVDFTIADFVADYRAPTPSAAAERLSPDQYEWRQNLDHLMDRILHSMHRKLAIETQKVDGLRAHIKHPEKKLQEHVTRLNELKLRLLQSEQRYLQTHTEKVQSLQKRLMGQSPVQKIEAAQSSLEKEQHKLIQAIKRTIENKHHQLIRNIQTLDAVSPLSTISRGYAIVSNNKDTVVKSINGVKQGDTIKTKLVDGYIHSQITEVEASKS